jgi:hypothetical protein
MLIGFDIFYPNRGFQKLRPAIFLWRLMTIIFWGLIALYFPGSTTVMNSF